MILVELLMQFMKVYSGTVCLMFMSCLVWRRKKLGILINRGVGV